MTAAKKVPATRTAAKRGPQKPLPCPFCGCKPKVREWFSAHLGIPMSEVACRSIRCNVKAEVMVSDRAEAIAAWNRRAK